MKIKLIALSMLLLALASCAKSQDLSNCLTGEPDSFFPGLIHGLISPFAFVSMLFSDDVTIYSSNNDGKWYALGFIIGTGGFTKLFDFIKNIFNEKKNEKSDKNS